MKRFFAAGIGFVAGGLVAASAMAEEIGSVSTVFKLVGPNDRIVI